MTRFILALIRFAALSLSFILSTLAAAVFLTFVLFLGSDISWLEEDVAVFAGSVAFTAGTWLSIAQLAFAPFVLIVLCLEFTRLSSLLSNLIAGGACALAVLFLALDGDGLQGLPYPARDIWIAVLSAGFVGGLSHWILAGYRAGRWLGPGPQIAVENSQR